MSSSVSTAEARRPLAPRLAIALIAALALVFGPLAALPASAVGGVTVDGYIALAPAADPTNSEVTLEVQTGTGDNAYWSYSNSTFTDVEGYYSFDGVEDGTYRISSGGPQDNGTYAYGIGESAPFPVAGDNVSIDDLTLTPGGSISGTTTDDDNGDPLAGVRVIAHRLLDGPDGLFDQRLEREATSDGDGAYSITGLRSGTYRLEFQADNHVTEYYNDVVNPSNDVNTEGIEDITIAAPEAKTDYDAALTPSGTIAGTVKDADIDGVGIGGVTVTAYQLVDTEGVSSWTYVTSTTTQTASEDPDYPTVPGSYSLTLPIGDYRIGFSDEDNGNYVQEFYDDQPTVDSAGATTLTVAAAETETADAVLAPAGHITGTVTSAEGENFSACVAAYPKVDGDYDLAAGPIATGQSFGSSYEYSLGGLPTGDYRVEFTDCGDENLASQYWDNAKTFADATDVPVDAGVDTPGIDAELVAAPTEGHLVGTVTEAGTHAKLAGIQVFVEQKYIDEGGDVDWSGVDAQATGASGTYDFTLFGGEDYRVKFTALDGTHFSEYYNDVKFAEDADDIPVAAGAEVTRDAELAPSAAITGTLTFPIANPTCIRAYSAGDTGLTTPYYGELDPGNGAYLIGELPTTGNYKVRFDCGGLQSGGASAAAAENWYLNKTSFADATLVPGVIGAATGLQPVVTTPPVVVPPAPPAPPAVVKVSPSVKVSVKAGKKKATLTITVRASNGTPTGKVSVKVGKKTYRVTLKNGKGKLTIKKLKKGKISFKVVYSGDAKVLGKTVKSKKVKIT